jgi:purine-cytosine permease-like protein
MLGRWATVIPRVIWNTVGVIIYTACALAGREHLAEIFTNFLALMGYWVSVWIAIFLEEHFLFHRKTGFNWAIWDQRNKLPLGIAALIAFLVGWVGAILCMAQVWYIGPLAKLVGEYGADVSGFGSRCTRRCANLKHRWEILSGLPGPDWFILRLGCWS